MLLFMQSTHAEKKPAEMTDCITPVAGKIRWKRRTRLLCLLCNRTTTFTQSL